MAVRWSLKLIGCYLVTSTPQAFPLKYFKNRICVIASPSRKRPVHLILPIWICSPWLLIISATLRVGQSDDLSVDNRYLPLPCVKVVELLGPNPNASRLHGHREQTCLERGKLSRSLWRGWRTLALTCCVNRLVWWVRGSHLVTAIKSPNECPYQCINLLERDLNTVDSHQSANQYFQGACCRKELKKVVTSPLSVTLRHCFSYMGSSSLANRNIRLISDLYGRQRYCFDSHVMKPVFVFVSLWFRWKQT